MPRSATEIIYIGDPLCSWCWGLAPELQRLREQHADEIGFQVILGGLRPGSTAPLDDKMERFLSHHWEQVAEASGQPFNHAILKSRTFVYDTEPPCRAVRVVRALKPEAEFDFFKSVQKAFYAKNMDTNDATTYKTLCTEFGIDPEEFRQAFESEAFREATAADFELARRMGVRSFPTVLLRIGNEIHLLAHGYAKFEQMNHAVNEAVQMA